MLIKTYGSAVYGVNAMNITVEVNAGDGTGYFLIGLPDNAVKESQWRIETAFKNTGLKMPRKKVVINMAPADIRKEGSAYDLTIAVGMLAVSDQISDTEKVGKYLIMGELSLDGGLLPIKGALPIAIQARKDGYEGFILPKQNARHHRRERDRRREADRRRGLVRDVGDGPHAGRRAHDRAQSEPA